MRNTSSPVYVVMMKEDLKLYAVKNIDRISSINKFYYL